MIKPLIVAFCVVSGFAVLRAQTPSWQPSPGHTQVPIWPGTPPDAQPVVGPEDTQTVSEDPPGAVVVGKVSRPTMTVYSPKGRNTGAAVVVFPGGGYWVLYMDLEGTEICDWLTSKGITCVLLKYRVPGEHLSPTLRRGGRIRHSDAVGLVESIARVLLAPITNRLSCRWNLANSFRVTRDVRPITKS